MASCNKKLKLAVEDVSDVSEGQYETPKTVSSHKIATEEEIEEDTQIQSSIPFYFEHIFGTYLSQTKNPTSIPTCSYETVSVLNSQGFLSREFETGARNSDSISPTSSPPSTCDPPDTPILFPSPENTKEYNSISTDNLGATPLNANPSSINVSIWVEKLTTAPQKSTKECIPPGLFSKEKTSRNKRKRSMSKSSDEIYNCPPSCTALGECVTLNKTVNLLAIVIQVNVAMDVACRKGMMAGQTVSMASLLLADPTKSYFKLSLWREASVWAERISIGDIVYFKSIRLKCWKDEMVGTTIMHSSVLNLHQPEKKLPSKVRHCIPDKPLTDLMKWGKEHFKYLFESHSIPKSQREVRFQTSQQLIGDSLVHFRAKLLCIISSRVVLLADQPDLNVHLHLLGSAASHWHSQLISGLGQVWEIMYVSVAHEETQAETSTYSLQTTSRTHFRILSESCAMSSEILKRVPSNGSGYGSFVTSDLSISEIISQQSSGLFEIKGNALSMEFILPDASKLSLASLLLLSPLEMVSGLCRAVYVGCEMCSQALSKDENGVYCQCLSCIMKFPGGYPSYSYFFRPLMVTLSDSKSASIVITASHFVIPKVFGISARDIVQASLSKNEGKIQNFRLLFSCSALWVVRCLVTMDENSFIEELSFSLVDFLK